MNNRKNEARLDRQRQRREAGSVHEHFPEVAGIVVSMTYSQGGTKSIRRTVNFSPGSDAYFIINCLSRDCVDGGFDLTQVITTLIRTRGAAVKGSLSCEGNDPPTGHSSIVYEVAIRYS